MTELNFEAWRKRVKVSTEEESASKRLTPAQEMSIPGDLDAKLQVLHDRIPGLISSYQKMVTLAERELQRLHMSAAEATRFAVSLQAVAEDMPGACHRCVPGGKCCDLCQGTGRGLGAVGDGWSRLAEQRERVSSSQAGGS
jgi:sorting nexin-8